MVERRRNANASTCLPCASAFDDLIKLAYRFNVLEKRPAEGAKAATEFVKYSCSCSEYGKKRFCPHVLAYALWTGEIDAPSRANGQQLTEANPSGRPSRIRQYYDHHDQV